MRIMPTSGAGGVIDTASGSGTDGSFLNQIINSPLALGVTALAGYVGYNAVMGD